MKRDVPSWDVPEALIAMIAEGVLRGLKAIHSKKQVRRRAD
jgi:hypothetical protein